MGAAGAAHAAPIAQGPKQKYHVCFVLKKHATKPKTRRVVANTGSACARLLQVEVRCADSLAGGELCIVTRKVVPFLSCFFPFFFFVCLVFCFSACLICFGRLSNVSKAARARRGWRGAAGVAGPARFC